MPAPVILREVAESRSSIKLKLIKVSQNIKKYDPEKSVLTSLDYDRENVLLLNMFWNLKRWLATQEG